MSKITDKVEVSNGGFKFWYLNDLLHREDGPAVEYPSGLKCWYLNGNLHREDGPALEHADGLKVWYLNGIRYTEEGFKKKLSFAVEMTISEIIAEIEELIGKKVRVVK